MLSYFWNSSDFFIFNFIWRAIATVNQPNVCKKKYIFHIIKLLPQVDSSVIYLCDIKSYGLKTKWPITSQDH